MKQDYDVFISYSSQDREIAKSVLKTLEEGNSIKCWIDYRDIAVGESYGEAIIKGLKRTKVYVLIYSRNSIQSNAVNVEVERAFNYERKIIPFRVEDVKPTDNMEFFTSSSQWLDALNEPRDQATLKLKKRILTILQEGKQGSQFEKEKPKETKTVETKPVETKTVETKTVKTKTVETKTVKTKTIEKKRVNSKQFAMLIDYANLYYSIVLNNNLKKHFKTKEELQKQVEEEVLRIIAASRQYLRTYKKYGKNGIGISQVTIVVLQDAGLGLPHRRLAPNTIKVEYVTNTGKTKEMKEMNQSRPDDAKLMEIGQDLIHNRKVDGLLVVTHDLDFATLCRSVKQMGGDFWLGIYEGKRQRASWELKQNAQEVIPLHEMIKGTDQGVPIPQTKESLEEMKQEIPNPHIAIYRQGEVIMRYPVNRPVIEIGRRSISRHHTPQIDLTDFDLNRNISRQHAVIENVNGQLVLRVHENCSTHVWVNGRPVDKGQSFFLDTTTQVLLGRPEDIFGLIFHNPSKKGD